MDEIERKIDQKYKLILSADKMEAYLIRRYAGTPPQEEEEASVEIELEELRSFLTDKNISYGIKPENLVWLIKNKEYYEEVLIAVGKLPKEGKSGYYEYTFDTHPNKKPIIREDGSVDYNTLGQMALCQPGDLLALYHPAVAGTDGMDIYGTVVSPRKTVDLPALKGKGFKISENGLEYYADMEGKVEFLEGRINISRLYIVEGDVDAVTGSINFNGDVLVKGNVYSDVVIEATGSITVNGHVEIATLKAGKDVILKNGMQGAGKGRVFAKGEVSANFFEQTIVIAEGNVNANAILNCNIESNKEVVVSGKRGVIVGGVTRAIERIKATVIGNKAETDTVVQAGLNLDIQLALLELDTSLEKLEDELNDISRDFKRIMEKSLKKPNELLLNRKTELMRDKILHESKIRELKAKKERLLDQRDRSLEAGIDVLGRLYPGVKISINNATETMRGECKNVKIYKRCGEVRFFSNSLA